jgi:hypothetical protein
MQADNTPYASYRVLVRFNSTNSTDVRDAMFNAVGSAGGSPCSGGYSRALYANVAALWARGPFNVSQNSKWLDLILPGPLQTLSNI